MLTIKETNIDGSSKELTFSSKTEAAEAIRTFFDFEKPESQKQREMRQQLNDTLRRAWKNTSTTDPSQIFDQARREL